MATVKKAFASDTLSIYDTYDYSAPMSNLIGHAKEGDVVKILASKFPGVLCEWSNGFTGWMCEWCVEI